MPGWASRWSAQRPTQAIAGGVLTVAGLLTLGACGDGPPAGAALAVYEGGTVTRKDLDARILALPANERRPDDGDFLAWHSRVVREIALEKILLAEAREAELETDAEVVEAIRETERQLVVAACLARQGDPPGAPTEAELEEAYEASRADFEQPRRRHVFHIFKRVEEGADPAAEREALEALGRRVRGGESFPDLAREHSDSESRHRNGMMGWFASGQLAPELDRMVFALDVQSPSDPIKTSTGLHMFWIESESPAISPTLDQIRPTIVQRALARKRLEHARSRVAIEPPIGSVIPESDDLEALVRTGDPQLLMLRIGEFEMNLADLQQRVAAGGAMTLSAVTNLVESLTVRELLYAQCAAESAEEPTVAAQVAAIRDRAMVDAKVRQDVLGDIAARREEVKAYFERNKRRYTEPLRLNLTRLSVPLGDAPSRRLGELENAVADLDAGVMRLDDLAQGLGGQVEELGWKRVSELQSDSGAMATLAVRLEPGQHSAPYVRGATAELLQLEERKEPVLLPLSRVESRVAEDMLANRGQEFFKAYSERILAERGFEILEAIQNTLPGAADPAQGS